MVYIDRYIPIVREGVRPRQIRKGATQAVVS
jgi:hypothetical protein